jgi:hypothetical protein
MKEHPTPENLPQFPVDRILHALGNPPVPEGLESRIATRLQTRVATHQSDRSTSHAWWRGAATGAAFATLAIGAVLFLQHRAQTHTNHAAPHDRASNPTPLTQPVPASLTAPDRSKPCAPIQMSHIAPTHTPTIEPTQRPITTAPLTAEERNLVLLARRADPKDLAILNPEMRAKLDADETAKFDEFFAPPPPLPTTDNQPN